MKTENKPYVTKKLEWESIKLNLNAVEIFFEDDISSLVDEIKGFLIKSDFLVIKNPTCFRCNSAVIAEISNAVLYDTNVTFYLELSSISINYEIYSGYDSFHVTKILDFKFSDFIDFEHSRFRLDKKFVEKTSANIYEDWIINSFNKNEKHFLTISDNFEQLGFILFGVMNDTVTIELIAIKPGSRNKKLGTKLLSKLIEYCKANEFKDIVVGTQVSNTNALNFYCRNGFRIKGTIDVYHWWK